MSSSLSFIAVRPLSAKRIIDTSSVRVTEKGILGSDHVTPVAGGLMDLRFGSQRDMVCTTCHQLADCIGHSGHYVLYRPILPYYFRQTIVQILRCICSSCHRLVLLLDTASQRPQLTHALTLDARRRFDEVTKLASNTKQCPHADCGMPLPNFKQDSSSVVRTWPPEAKFPTPEDKAVLTAPLSTTEILTMLRAVPSEVSEGLFGMAPGSRVEDLVMTVLPIASTKIRPSMGSASKARARRDDFTDMYHRIIEDDQRLRAMEAKSGATGEPDLVGGVTTFLPTVAEDPRISSEAVTRLDALTKSIDELLATIESRKPKAVVETKDETKDETKTTTVVPDACRSCEGALFDGRLCFTCDTNDCFQCDARDCITLPCIFCRQRVGTECCCVAQLETVVGGVCATCVSSPAMQAFLGRYSCARCGTPFAGTLLYRNHGLIPEWVKALQEKRGGVVVIDRVSSLLCSTCV